MIYKRRDDANENVAVWYILQISVPRVIKLRFHHRQSKHTYYSIRSIAEEIRLHTPVLVVILRNLVSNYKKREKILRES